MDMDFDTGFWMWIGFFATVVFLLVMDLGLLHRKEREIGVRESLWLSAGYIAIAMGFGFVIHIMMNGTASSNYFTAYFIEKSLSMDNIFVMSMVFAHFHIPRLYQHRVLFWGILGVVLLRGVMIGVGSSLIHHFHSILYIFGIFLVVTGLRMLLAGEKSDEKTLEENKLLVWLRSHMKVTKELHGNRFFVGVRNTRSGKITRRATPLFLVLIFIELADVVFAVDSVPAVFAVTDNPFIVYTSNIFAILGLRSLYFALSAMLHRFSYLKYALALVLIFIGGKIFLAKMLPISSGLSLAITLSLLLGGVIVSLYKTKNRPPAAVPPVASTD